VWEVILLEEVEDWFLNLEGKTAEQVEAAIDNLAERGPALGRPLVDTVHHSSVSNLKELRPGSEGSTEVRILFAFDPWRQAVLLVAGDKSGQWKDWYRLNVPVAEERFDAWINNYVEGGG
jgi:hypothetical protein